MIKAAPGASRTEKDDNSLGASEIENFRKKINDQEYLRDAIQRIALIMSNDLLDIPYGGRPYERQRKGRR
jgi:hypothetical protein